MKIIPIIRFSVVAYMVYNMIEKVTNRWGKWDEIDITLNILIIFFTLGFIVYSINEGLKELKNVISSDIKYLRIYGLAFQILTLIGGTFALITLDSYLSWRVTPPIIFLIGYLVLTIVDLKKLKQSY